MVGYVLRQLEWRRNILQLYHNILERDKTEIGRFQAGCQDVKGKKQGAQSCPRRSWEGARARLWMNPDSVGSSRTINHPWTIPAAFARLLWLSPWQHLFPRAKFNYFTFLLPLLKVHQKSFVLGQRRGGIALMVHGTKGNQIL